jgi:hypothetical protein
MKKFLFRANYGWSEYEFNNSPYSTIVEINAKNEEEAIEKVKDQYDRPQFPEEGHPNGMPFWWKVTGICEWEEGKNFKRDHKEIFLSGHTGE